MRAPPRGPAAAAASGGAAALGLALASLFAGAGALSVASPKDDAAAAVAPVTKVVNILEQMRTQVQKEAEEDEDLYEKMECWCKTNDKEKVEAIAHAERRIEQLNMEIEEGKAQSATLANEIKALKIGIQEDQDALAEATSLHEKEREDYDATEADLMESSTILGQAIKVLSGVQGPNSAASMLQKKPASEAAHQRSLLEVRSLLARAADRVGRSSDSAAGAAAEPGAVRRHSGFGSVMQKDLWDLMSTIPHAGEEPVGAGRVIMGLSQQPLQGAAAGASSYSSRSSSIYGMLQQMKENMDKNLAQSQRESVQAEIDFQRLRASKMGEIQVAQASLQEKSDTLADVEQKLVQDKEDLETTTAGLDADQKFLVDLRKRCTTAAEDFGERRSTRTEEIAAIGEAIAILRTDDARDTFSKSMSLLQVRRVASARASASERARSAAAAKKLLGLARRRSGAPALELAKLSVSVQLDGLEKVKDMMAKMVADLKKQQSDEHEKHENCKGELKSNGAESRARQSDANEANRQISALETTKAQLEEDLEELHKEVAAAHVELKRAGEDRQAENHEFQQVVADQKATQVVLQQALERLRKFYDERSFLMLKRQDRREPGKPSSAPPPSAGLEYNKSKAATGVLEMLEKIMADSKRTQQEAIAAEQAASDSYAELVANTNEMLDASAASIREKEELHANTEADRMDRKQDLASAGEALSELNEAAKAIHLQCDYLLRNYDVRQKGRQDEIEAVQQAISILSGANFGTGEEAA